MSEIYDPQIESLINRPLHHVTPFTDAVEPKGDFLGIPMSVQRTQRHIEAVVCPTKKEETQLVISTQQGCKVKCWFCDMGDLDSGGSGNSLTPKEMLDELTITMQEGEKHNYGLSPDALKITFAKGGEPFMNPRLIEFLETIKDRLPVKLKISTTFPDTPVSHQNFDNLVEFAADYPGIIQLQISILSTDSCRREEITRVHPISFLELRQKAEEWHRKVQNPRKFLLSFTLDSNTPCCPEAILVILPPEYFAIRLRRWIPTKHGEQHGLERPELLDVKILESRFADFGYKIIPGESTETEVKHKLTAGYNQRRTSAQVDAPGSRKLQSDCEE